MNTLPLRWLFLVTLSLVCTLADAQKEASIWFLGGGYGLDFTKTPSPQQFTIPPDEYPTAGYATIADGDGNLIFYTDGQTVFNSNGQVVQDGRGLLGIGYRQVIVPKPGTSKHYYIFYIGIRSANQQYFEVMYAIVDMTANSGNGKVIEKNTTLYLGLHGWFTVSGGCKTNDFWFLGEADRNVSEGTDKIFAYHITADGIGPRVVSARL